MTGFRNRARHHRFRPEILALEPRLALSTLSIAQPSPEEQYMLQLVNRARANPQEEGTRLASLARNDPTLRAAITEAEVLAFAREIARHLPSAPLAFNTRLIASSRVHGTQMVATNTQFHSNLSALVDSAPSSVAGDGQPYLAVGTGAWTASENVFAYSGNLRDPHGKPLVDYFHSAFLLDWGNPNFGHLRNLLNPGPSGARSGVYPMSEIGIGILTDVSPTMSHTARASYPGNQGLTVGPAVVTQQLAWRAGQQFLTGAVFTDRDGDRFYTPGEGNAGVTIQAVGRHGEGTFTTQVWASGGYSLALPSGTYDVVARGGSLADVRSTTITIGVDNVGWDVMAVAAAPVTTTPAVPVAPTPIVTPPVQARPTTPTTPPQNSATPPQSRIPTKKQLAAIIAQRRRELARLRQARRRERMARQRAQQLAW